MNKETHDIPITLVLPRYEAMAIAHALQGWAELERNSGDKRTSEDIDILAKKIFSITREHVMAFEDQHEEENPNPK